VAEACMGQVVRQWLKPVWDRWSDVAEACMGQVVRQWLKPVWDRWSDVAEDLPREQAIVFTTGISDKCLLAVH